MFKKIYYQYILIMLSSLILIHIVFSYLLAKTTNYFHKDFLLNVRNIAEERPLEMANAYLTEHIRSTKLPIMLILGSSYSYGQRLKVHETYSHFLTTYFPNFNISNASIIGDSGGYAIQMLFQMKQKNLHVDKLILELNLFNFTSSNFSRGNLEALPNKTVLGLNPNNSLFEFFLLHPKGAAALAKLDLSRILGSNSVQPYRFVQLPDTYSISYEEFEKKLPMNTSFLKTMLSIAAEVADNVYFFVAPIYGKGILQSQFKISDITREVDIINKICNSMPKIHCLNPGLNFSEENFIDIAHANMQGHQTLAAWLAPQIDSNKV